MSRDKMRVVCCAIVVAVVSGLFLNGKISHAANVWDGGATPDANWSAANNWDNNLVPVFPAQLTFGGAVNLLPNNDLGNVAVDGIIFDAVGGSFSIGGQAFTLGDPATADYRRALIRNDSAALQTIANNLTLSRGQHNISTTLTGGLTLSGSLTRSAGAGAHFVPILGTSIKTTLSNNAAGIIGGWATIQNPSPDPLRPNETAAYFAKVDGSGNVVPYGDADYMASGGGTPATDFDIDGDAGETMLPSAPTLNTNVRWQGAMSTGFDLVLPAGTTNMHTFLYDAPQFYPGTVNGSETVQIGGGNTLRFASGGGIYRSNNTGVNAAPANDSGVVFAGGAAVVGDYDNDGTVGASDYVVWREAEANAATLLVNRDPAEAGNPVGLADYNAWKANFGNTSLATITAGNSAAPAELVFWTNTNVNSGVPSDPGEHHNRIIDLTNTIITDNPEGGAVTVIKNGPGAVRTSNTGVIPASLTATTSNAGHTFTGGLYINRGVWRSDIQTRPSTATVPINEVGSGGFGLGPVYVASGAQAFPQTDQIINNDFFISGTGIDEGDFHVGAIRSNADGNVFNGTITLLADARIGARGSQATNAHFTNADLLDDGTYFNGKITGNFNLEWGMGVDQGGATLTADMPTMILTNSSNDWGGNTTLGRGRLRIGGAGEVIPHGPGAGNVTLFGELDYFTAPAVQAASGPTVLTLDSKTETINGLFSAGTLVDTFNGTTDLVIITNSTDGVGTLRVGANNATSTYGGVITDDVSVNGLVKIVKIGSGDLTLTGERNNFNGGLTVEAGKVIIDPTTDDGDELGDNGDISVLAGALLQLNYTGFDSIRSLFLNGVQKAAGEWGAPGSGAPMTDALLAGTGRLFVTVGPGFAQAVPEPGTVVLLLVATLCGLNLRSRRSVVR